MIMKRTNILTLTAAAILLSACSSLDGEPTEGSLVPIRLATGIQPTTRANTQDVQLLSGETVYFWANEEATAGATDWSANPYIKAWTLTTDGSGTLTTSSQYYYPPKSLSMVAIHGNFADAPYTEGSTAIPASVSHSVADDQSLQANYAKSDLLCWAANNKTVTADNVTLQFAHKLSKVEITLTSSEYTAQELSRAVVTLTSIKPTVGMTIGNDVATTKGTMGAVSGDATAIIPYKPDASTAYFEAIVPCGQEKPTGFISVTMNGQTFSVNPDAPADAANFLENKKYQYTLTLSRTAVSVTSSISEWTPVAGTAATSVGPKNLEIRKNPLWYMAQYNVADEKGTTFATEYNAGYFFTWEDAMRNFCYVGGTTYSNTESGGSQTTYAGTVGAQCNIEGYHMPIAREWNGIIPVRTTSNTGIELFNAITADVGTATAYSATTEVCFGYNDVTRGTSGVYMTEQSYWYKKSATELYAIRYCNSDYCSIWKYEWADNSALSENVEERRANPGTLTITSRLLGEKLSVSEAASNYGTTEANWIAPFSGLVFDHNENDETHNAVKRVMAAKGITNTGSGAMATDEIGKRIYGYACTEFQSTEAEYAYGVWIFNSNISMGDGRKTTGRPIRLFRDNDTEAAASERKTTVAEATTSQLTVGDIVCSDGSIFAADKAAAVATEGRTPVGIIAFVNDGTAIGNAATENGCGRYAIKSQGRALVWCAINANNNNSICYSTDAANNLGMLWALDDTNLENPEYYHGFDRTVAMNSATYPAAQACYNFSNFPAPAYSTGWFCPSVGQWKKILIHVFEVNNPQVGVYYAPWVDVVSSANEKLTAIETAGGTIQIVPTGTSTWWWTCSEYTSSMGCLIFCTEANGIGMHGYNRTSNNKTRPVFAF